jgi:membrane-bound lytic murein transglycosylase B
MQQFRNPRTGGVQSVPDVLAGFMKQRGWVPAQSDLKGAALDEALEKAGLPKTGTADEKRARLAEHNHNPVTPEEQA